MCPVTLLARSTTSTAGCPFRQREQVLAHAPAVFDNVELAFGVDGANTLGTFNADGVRHLEADAGLAEGHLRKFARQIAESLQLAVIVAEALPDRLKELPAVALYPHATYTQDPQSRRRPRLTRPRRVTATSPFGVSLRVAVPPASAEKARSSF